MRYLYHETTEKEEQEINKALLADNELRELYQSMSAMKNELDKAQLEPAASTVLNILSYSRNEQHHEH
ncbi:MAG TPA: hypothetical protein PK325_12380 [Cyclobacteriaceae bacterium]|nr:hypothetical protein [Cyclobacteriaceae bacterium]TXH25010.1 MAG: hypothetical protein E6Q96_09615 [Cyclobacteriaceae bacterium]HMV07957.1 hypothetical protein [Cyclobacteriaceae bacterium]HMV88225.1 hypothetical protein [Cyclobacteriaceae bacterium]HMW99091.1 hypothetical protein [Cyclobacteriaceae bacterium]